MILTGSRHSPRQRIETPPLWNQPCFAWSTFGTVRSLPEVYELSYSPHTVETIVMTVMMTVMMTVRMDIVVK